MAQQVLFYNATGQVIQWQDTSIGNYAPPSTNTSLLPVTSAQWANKGTASQWWVVGGVLTSTMPLAWAKQIQTTLIQNAAAQAETINLSYTSIGGVTKTYLMDQNHQFRLMGAYQAYVLGAQEIPANFSWKASDGTLVPFEIQDITNLHVAAINQYQNAWAKEQSLLAQINAATTVSAVQVIVW